MRVWELEKTCFRITEMKWNIRKTFKKESISMFALQQNKKKSNSLKFPWRRRVRLRNWEKTGWRENLTKKKMLYPSLRNRELLLYSGPEREKELLKNSVPWKCKTWQGDRQKVFRARTGSPPLYGNPTPWINPIQLQPPSKLYKPIPPQSIWAMKFVIFLEWGQIPILFFLF